MLVSPQRLTNNTQRVVSVRLPNDRFNINDRNRWRKIIPPLPRSLRHFGGLTEILSFVSDTTTLVTNELGVVDILDVFLQILLEKFFEITQFFRHDLLTQKRTLRVFSSLTQT